MRISLLPLYLICLLGANCITFLTTKDQTSYETVVNKGCYKNDGLILCPIPEENIWFMGPFIPVIPLFGAPTGKFNESCYHKCVGFEIRNESDSPVQLLLKPARLKQGNNDLAISSIRRKVGDTLSDVEESWPEIMQLEVYGTVQLYLRGFRRGQETARIKGLQYCRASACREFSMRPVHISTRWDFHMLPLVNR